MPVKTVQKLPSWSSSVKPAASAGSSPIFASSRSAISSRKLPVPAAHLRFILWPMRRPSASTRMIFASCPPMSITVSGPGT